MVASWEEDPAELGFRFPKKSWLGGTEISKRSPWTARASVRPTDWNQLSLARWCSTAALHKQVTARAFFLLQLYTFLAPPSHQESLPRSHGTNAVSRVPAPVSASWATRTYLLLRDKGYRPLPAAFWFPGKGAKEGNETHPGGRKYREGIWALGESWQPYFHGLEEFRFIRLSGRPHTATGSLPRGSSISRVTPTADALLKLHLSLTKALSYRWNPQTSFPTLGNHLLSDHTQYEIPDQPSRRTPAICWSLSPSEPLILLAASGGLGLWFSPVRLRSRLCSAIWSRQWLQPQNHHG